jgi:hypothetical protein
MNYFPILRILKIGLVNNPDRVTKDHATHEFVPHHPNSTLGSFDLNTMLDITQVMTQRCINKIP